MKARLRWRWVIGVVATAATLAAAGVTCGPRLAATLSPSYHQIDEGLYLGGAIATPPPGTTAVLNVSQTPDPYRVEAHRWEPIPDGPPAPSVDWLRRQVAFVTAQREEGRTVYVHCRAGVSRSGMVVVAYEMARHGWGFDEALRYVRTRRKVVTPNPTFWPLLREWERVVKATPRT